MKSPLHILHLEDDAWDEALVQSTLEAESVDCIITCVNNREDFVTALEKGEIDLVLSDYSLPAFSGSDAISMIRERWPDLPIILVSGTMGEEKAIESLKNGATDYVLKERLGRLAPAVRRAMHEVEAKTERELLKAQFIESQKMEVMGQLASGVAHDFNNLISVIMGCSELVAAQLDAGSPLQKFVEEIRHASERAAGLTRQLLVFSRKHKVMPVVLDINQVIQEIEPILLRLMDENIELTILPEKQIGNIEMDSGYLGQVLMNLAVNARDAMPHGGKITIGTSHVSLQNISADLPPGIIPGDYVLLRVSDTGTGMTDEVKAHLFEAFFTTKPSGKGTGLGLATCQTIIEESGGYVNFYSKVGKGTTFKIFFPCIDQPLSLAVGETLADPSPRGRETLMIVEDEPSVRHLVADVLESQGYTVLRAPNGQEGLHIAQVHLGEPISLVITDVVMPLMGGIVMAEWLKESYPDLKILFTSGYTEEEMAKQGAIGQDVEFLPKPYAPTILIRKVREMLDRDIS